MYTVINNNQLKLSCLMEDFNIPSLLCSHGIWVNELKCSAYISFCSQYDFAVFKHFPSTGKKTRNSLDVSNMKALAYD